MQNGIKIENEIELK